MECKFDLEMKSDFRLGNIAADEVIMDYSQTDAADNYIINRMIFRGKVAGEVQSLFDALINDCITVIIHHLPAEMICKPEKSCVRYFIEENFFYIEVSSRCLAAGEQQCVIKGINPEEFYYECLYEFQDAFFSKYDPDGLVEIMSN